jgi:hypothetical protein
MNSSTAERDMFEDYKAMGVDLERVALDLRPGWEAWRRAWSDNPRHGNFHKPVQRERGPRSKARLMTFDGTRWEVWCPTVSDVLVSDWEVRRVDR